MTSVSISVQWRAVDCIDRNGNTTGYTVLCTIAGSGGTWKRGVLGHVTEATISGLKPSNYYYIFVAAVNSAGTGLYSLHVTAYTDGI